MYSFLQALVATEINRIWNSQSVVKYNHYCVILLIDPLIKSNERRHYCVFVSDRVKLQVWLLKILTIEMVFENYSAVKYSKVEAATRESRLNIQTKKRQRSRFILQHQTQLNTEGLTQSCLRFTQRHGLLLLCMRTSEMVRMWEGKLYCEMSAPHAGAYDMKHVSDHKVKVSFSALCLESSWVYAEDIFLIANQSHVTSLNPSCYSQTGSCPHCEISKNTYHNWQLMLHCPVSEIVW